MYNKTKIKCAVVSIFGINEVLEKGYKVTRFIPKSEASGALFVCEKEVNVPCEYRFLYLTFGNMEEVINNCTEDGWELVEVRERKDDYLVIMRKPYPSGEEIEKIKVPE